MAEMSLRTCFLVFALVSCMLTACDTTRPSDLALPHDTNVVAPLPDVTVSAARFSGKWGGYWQGDLPGVLIVEQISADGSAKIVYAWGDAPHFGVRSGFARYEGRILDGKLMFATGTSQYQFEMTPEGSLRGTLSGRGVRNAITMTRLP